LEGQFANPDRQRQRVETLGAVLRSAATIVIWTIALLMIGDTLGLNMAPVLASAGVGGLAIGFGAQSLVKDFLSGMFMLAEDQYGVGDVIDTGDAIGTVEDVTMRMTRLRDASGVVWYVRNGEIRRIGNRSQGWSTALVDLPVGAEESAQHVIDVLGAAMTAFDADPAWSEHLLEAPTVAGVESVGGGAITVRITARCPANQHIAVQRAIRERALAALAQAGIRLAPGAPPSGPVPAPASS